MNVDPICIAGCQRKQAYSLIVLPRINKVNKKKSIDSVPQVIEVVYHDSNAPTNEPTKRDDRVVPFIFPLHNADKASADPPIG